MERLQSFLLKVQRHYDVWERLDLYYHQFFSVCHYYSHLLNLCILNINILLY